MIRRILTLVGATLAVVAVVSATALAAESRYTPQAERAMGERYQAMAEHFLGTEPSYPPAALKALGERYTRAAEYFASLEPSYTPAAIQAMGERYTAMAEYYDARALADARADAAAFDWTDAFVGALFAVGVIGASVLLVVEVRRHAHHHPPTAPA
jgi:hypothetical protein